MQTPISVKPLIVGARLLLISALLILVPAASGDELRLASVFGDHMVLQRGSPVAVWGTAEAGQTVNVQFAGQQKSAQVNGDGTWQIQLDPLSASGDAKDLTVAVVDNRIVLHDVLVGEVWLCTGQSNMSAPLHEFDSTGQEAKAAEFPQIRMIHVPERPAVALMPRFDSSWEACSPATAASMSAFGYYFSRQLNRELKVPIGIVLCAWGGSSVAAWMSPEALSDPKLRQLMPYDVIGWRENCRPSMLYLGMLKELAPYTAKGIIWYQGETEGEPDQNAYAYRFLFPAMIEDWRRLWKQSDLPFYFVQLPRLINKPQWPVVREGQAAALALPSTGMIVTLDYNHDHELHPKNKQAFAERMAALVSSRCYGGTQAVDYPAIQSVTRENGKMIVHCANAGGLKTSDGQPPRCFEIAASDRKFIPAQATIAGSTITVSSDSVTDIAALRYAYDGDPNANVVNNAGLPMAPFRSDDWPVPTSELSPVELPSKAPLDESATAEQIIGGSDKTWQWSGSGVNPADLEDARMLRKNGSGSCQLAAANRLRLPLETKSPVLTWQRPVTVDPHVGFTATIVTQIFRATAPQAGVDLRLSVAGDKQVRVYQITVAPMFLYGLQDDEIRVLGSNLDNCARVHTYRIAVRPDGIAQIYFDHQMVGTLRPTVASEGEGHKESSMMFGKGMPRGEFTANIDRVSIDSTGPFAP